VPKVFVFKKDFQTTRNRVVEERHAPGDFRPILNFELLR